LHKKFPEKINFLKLDSANFIDGNPLGSSGPNKSFPPENSRFVNLGAAIFLSGGLDSNMATDLCFMISINQETSKYSAIVTVYQRMNEKKRKT